MVADAKDYICSIVMSIVIRVPSTHLGARAPLGDSARLGSERERRRRVRLPRTLPVH